MPSPKDGKAGTLVSPAEPKSALDADKADPGEIAKIKASQQDMGKGKYGESPVKPFKSGPTDPDEKGKPTHWIEVQLIDDADQPVPGEAYRIEMPDGRIHEGTLNEKGLVRVDGIPDAGNCKVSFPKLDQDAWAKA